MKHLYVLWALLILLAVTTVVFAVRVQNTQDTVHRILCDGKANNQESLRTSIQFLRDHPNGTADFSRAFIVSAIQQDRTKAETFSGLSCS